MEITVRVRKEGTGYWSEVAELPGCFASAGTLAELEEALAEAVGLYLGDAPAQLDEAQISVGEQVVSVTAR